MEGMVHITRHAAPDNASKATHQVIAFVRAAEDLSQPVVYTGVDAEEQVRNEAQRLMRHGSDPTLVWQKGFSPFCWLFAWFRQGPWATLVRPQLAC
eukprot:scaffold152379_cov29-Tisochrysis_lutea.AAC.2